MRSIALALFLAAPALAADGRWQIVNPTPNMVRNTMLLDTQTGQAWVTCLDDAGHVAWCGPVKRTSGTITPGSDKPDPPKSE